MLDARCRVGSGSRLDAHAWPVRDVMWVSYWLACSVYQTDDFQSRSRCAAGLDLCRALVRQRSSTHPLPVGSGWGKLGGDNISSFVLLHHLEWVGLPTVFSVYPRGRRR